MSTALWIINFLDTTSSVYPLTLQNELHSATCDPRVIIEAMPRPTVLKLGEKETIEVTSITGVKLLENKLHYKATHPNYSHPFWIAVQNIKFKTQNSLVVSFNRNKQAAYNHALNKLKESKMTLEERRQDRFKKRNYRSGYSYKRNAEYNELVDKPRRRRAVRREPKSASAEAILPADDEPNPAHLPAVTLAQTERRIRIEQQNRRLLAMSSGPVIEPINLSDEDEDEPETRPVSRGSSYGENFRVPIWPVPNNQYRVSALFAASNCRFCHP